MSCLSASGNVIVVARGSLVDAYNMDTDTHAILRLSSSVAAPGSAAERDIIDVALSPDGAMLAVMTGASKRLIVYELARPDAPTVFNLPRAASRARFTADSSQVLVADKTGDALLYDLKDTANSGVKLFGHLSVLLDILMTDDGNYVITSDRDEKIRISHYPNTYNIKAYCLGHKEFVKHVQLLPSDKKFLLSASGDGCIKIWDYIDGRLCHTIETEDSIDDKQYLESFIEVMDKEGVEVTALPIVHMSSMQLNAHSNLVAVTLHTYGKILVYHTTVKDQQFEHKLHSTLSLERFPSAMQFSGGKLFACIDGDECSVQVYQAAADGENGDVLRLLKTCKMFIGEEVSAGSNRDGDINVLYKRKFDNVQEYQDRKRQRLEKHGES